MSNSEVQVPQEGDIWQHYKGRCYEVVGVAIDTETNHRCVVYRSEEGQTFVRPLLQWAMMLTLKGGQQVHRFTIVQRTYNQTDLLPHEDTNPAPPIAVPLSIDGAEVQA